MPSEVDTAEDAQDAEDAFANGDFAVARQRASAVLMGAASEADKQRAQKLLEKTQNDRAVLVLLAACVVFFLVIVVTYARPG